MPVSPLISTAIVDCASRFTVAITCFIAAFLTITADACAASSRAALPSCTAEISSSTEPPSVGNVTTLHASGGCPPLNALTSPCTLSAVDSGSDTSTDAGP